MSLTVVTAKTVLQRQSCYAIRRVVFVDEQLVPIELEIDEHDETDAIHFLGSVDGTDVATGRVVVRSDGAKIQRVAVLSAYRGLGYGYKLMETMIAHIDAERLAKTITLDAQTHATAFYYGLGFSENGKEFDDAGIAHINMTRTL